MIGIIVLSNTEIDARMICLLDRNGCGHGCILGRHDNVRFSYKCKAEGGKLKYLSSKSLFLTLKSK